MSNSIRAKYFWPEIEGDVNKMVESCEACQVHQRAQQRGPNRESPIGRPLST